MITYTVFDDDGSSEEIQLPSKRIVCPRCYGEGTQDVWEGGMTGDEMAEQGPEFREDYMNGVYSKPCEECKGRNVIDVVDRDRAPAALLARYDATEKEKADYAAECAAEQRYAGYF